jgi:hypothetical protein
MREAEISNRGDELAAKALALVRPHAAEKEAVQVLTWILNTQPASASASEAAKFLVDYHLMDPETLDTATRWVHVPLPWAENLLQALAGADLPRRQQIRAALGLAECIKAKTELPAIMQNWDPATEKMARAMYGNEFLAEAKAADPAKLEDRATRLFQQAALKYGADKYLSTTVADYVQHALFEMKHLSVGKPAPEIEGVDIDGSKFKLSDYRGKVVLLDFWGNW